MYNLFRVCRKDEISFDIVAETGNIVAKNGNNVEATFDIVERIVQLVAFDNVAVTFLLVWRGLLQSCLLLRQFCFDIVASVDRALSMQECSSISSCASTVPVHSRSFDAPTTNEAGIVTRWHWRTTEHAVHSEFTGVAAPGAKSAISGFILFILRLVYAL